MKGDTRPASKGDKSAPAAEPGFDESLARLEEIVGLLDQESLGLEDALAKYKEGVELLRRCQATLASFQKQVEELSTGDGTTRPYGGDPDVRAPQG